MSSAAETWPSPLLSSSAKLSIRFPAVQPFMPVEAADEVGLVSSRQRIVSGSAEDFHGAIPILVAGQDRVLATAREWQGSRLTGVSRA
ncbi:MAG TPA: hypothetical protein VFR34_15195 [Paracoccaceae bacterium]|nr:hypothetical protein [Paracoccaceae bacterium]